MAAYAGRNGVIYISVSGTTAAVSIVNMKTWSLDMPTDKIEVTAFGDSFKKYVQGLPDVTGSLSGWWDDTSDQLYDASRSTDGVKLYLYPSSNATTKYWYGPAWVDFSITTDVSGAVEVTANFAGNGAWGQL